MMGASAILISLLFVSANCLEFKSNADDFVSVSHKKIVRRRQQIDDFEKIVVSAQILSMVDDVDAVDKSRVTLELKSEVSSSWSVVESGPSVKAGSYVWIIPDLVPCHSHEVRLTVFSVDGAPSVFLVPHSLPGADKDQMKNSGYKPAPPTDISIGDYHGGSVEITWSGAYCADNYEVTYYPMIRGSGKTESFPHVGERMTLTNLESCQEYQLSIISVAGDEWSEETNAIMMTSPETDVADRLEPLVEAGTDHVQVKWRGSEKLSCISEYQVRLCEESGECGDQVQLSMDDSHQFMEFSNSAPLDMCTSYTLTISPLHSSAHLSPRLVQFRTKSQGLDNVEQSLAPLTAAVDDSEQSLKLSWSGVSCAEVYTVYRKDAISGEWVLVRETVDTSLELPVEACSVMEYAVTVTIDGEESGRVETLEAITTKVRDMELPVMTVEEKGNGSMTFILTSSQVNTMCAVDKLHIKHAGTEEYYNLEEIVDNRITVNIVDESPVQGRLHYSTFDTWSPWGSSDSPIMEKQTLEEMDFLLPIIIGSGIAVVIIILVIVLIVKSKSKKNYDQEKANGNTEEAKKLNDSTEKSLP